MKCVKHKQDETLRVMQRGKRFYVQRDSGTKATRSNDPWQDIGKGRDTFLEAQAAMYNIRPMVTS